MRNFKELTDLPHYHNLLDHLSPELKECLDSEGRIGLNTVPGHEHDYTLGNTNLLWTWEDGVKKARSPRLHERDFGPICNVFKDTIWEELYNILQSKYVLGRVRIFKSLPGTCLSWHEDYLPRIHYPIKTQKGCFMLIEDEVQHLDQEKWWWTETSKYHTAFNGSPEERIHLVAVVRDKK
jgi:hypothetical protein